MAMVKIPKDKRPNWECEINGVKYSYPAGTEQEVPEAVAELIENLEELRPKTDSNAGGGGAVGGGGYDMVITCRAIDSIYGNFDYETMHVVSGSYENVVKKLLAGEYVDIRFYCVGHLNEFGTANYPHSVTTIRYSGGEEIEMMVDLGSDGLTTIYMHESGEFYPDWG